jgi:hypothetical protein
MLALRGPLREKSRGARCEKKFVGMLLDNFATRSTMALSVDASLTSVGATFGLRMKRPACDKIRKQFLAPFDFQPDRRLGTAIHTSPVSR